MTIAEKIREKTIKEWAKELNMSLARVYQLRREGQLEAKIDGVWSPKVKIAPTYFGKSSSEWAKQLNVKQSKILYLVKIGRLKYAAKTGDVSILKPRGRIIKGKNLATWAKLLGITRERARQLANENLLLDRIKKLK